MALEGIVDNYEVHCGNCHWWGMLDQLKVVYRPDPRCPTCVVPEPACPMCLSDQYLEYEEDSNLILKRAVAVQSYARLKLKIAIRSLKEAIEYCQTYQSEKSEEE